MYKPKDSEEQTGQLGQSTIEFAVAVSLFLLLTLGMMDFSRAVYAASAVQAAAQEGARAGIVDLDDVMPAINARLVGMEMDQMTVTVSQPTIESVQVDVRYEFQFITPVISGLLGESIELRGSSSMIIY